MTFTKKCPGCRKEFTTEVRHQKYCTSLCRDKYNKRLKKNRQWADEHKALLRMKARSHALAVSIVDYQYHSEGKDLACELCNSTERLEVHHIDLVFLNNTPSNLQLLCNKCHAKVHSDIINQCKEEGTLVKSRYEQSFYNMVSDIIKEPTVRIQRISDKQWYAGSADGVQLWDKHKSKALLIGESDPILYHAFSDRSTFNHL